jgi:hypothetical protein
MPSRIATVFGLDTNEQKDIEQLSRPIKSLFEWFTEITDALKDTSLLKFLGAAGEAAKEWSGAVKAASKLLERLTKEQSPMSLGWLACTLAYQRAATEAIIGYGRPASRIPFSQEVVSDRLKHLQLEDPYIMRDFSMNSTAGHPFLRAADEALRTTLEAAGYDPAEQRNLLRETRTSFKPALQDLLSGEHKDKYIPFTQWLALDNPDRKLQTTLLSFIDHDRVEFEDQPALGIEPFSVSDVYIESQCGLLQWKTIRDGRETLKDRRIERVDPFSEDSAQRQDLITTVLGLMSDPSFNDCIVIQGAPGSGKSTFTKRLSIRLRAEGLLPIRIPLQYLRVDSNIFDAIQDVILKFSGTSTGSFRRNLFREKVFSDEVEFGKARISSYVFIFDGWDEVSLSADEGFQQRVERLLDSIRQAFLDQNTTKIRVVVTGRPSQAVGRTNFLGDDTPVLTIRPIRPEQLEAYVANLADALAKPSFRGPQIDEWSLGAIGRYSPVLELYKKSFPEAGPLEVLGQPLLAHLGIRVMANFKQDLIELITTPTSLYRHLIDLTCKKGGKAPTDTSRSNKSGRIEGRDLRALLHGTALAITAYGTESIPIDELEMRLETLGVGKDVFVIAKDAPLANLANLMISFYFKSVQTQSGCEFLHKSFREYLAAEAIIEILKEYSRITQAEPMPERAPYWRDFDGGDPRWWLSRKLGEALSPQWLTPEISKHLDRLLQWEVQREANIQDAPQASPLSTEPLSLSKWGIVRDGLADLWDWWGEGVHLRPQPKERQKLWNLDEPPYVFDLVKLAMRRSNFNRRTAPRPIRTATVDAHFGYALFQLNCILHCYISEAAGWRRDVMAVGSLELWKNIADGGRRYQVLVIHKDTTYVQFAPSGGSADYFRNYIDRINGAGVKPGSRSHFVGDSTDFPASMMMRGVYLVGANLDRVALAQIDFTSTYLAGARLHLCELIGSDLSYSVLDRASLFSASLYGSKLDYAEMSGVNLFIADVRETNLEKVLHLSQADLNFTCSGNIEVSLPQGLKAPEHWAIAARLVAEARKLRVNALSEKHEGPLTE